MGGALMIARSRLRRRWRTVAVIGLLITIAGGVVLTTLAGARRTETALDRLRRSTRASTTGILLFDGVDSKFAARIGHLPGAHGWGEAAVWAAGVRDPKLPEVPIAAAVDGRFGRVVDRSILLEGRRARTAHEVVLPKNVADHGYVVGSTLPIQTYAPDQLETLRSTKGGALAPRGPAISLRVVGIDRRVGDLTTQGEKTGIIFLGPEVYAAYHRRVLAFADLVRVRVAPKTARRFAPRFRAIAGDRKADFDTGGLDTGGVDDSLSVLGTGLVLFAALAALGALVVLVVLLQRWAAATGPDQPVERALGRTARGRIAGVALPVVPAIGGGAIGALWVAALGSTFMPIGAARSIEPHLGFDLDATVLVGGLAAIMGLGLLATVATAWWGTRRACWDPASAPGSVRTGRVVAAVTRSRLPIPAVVGAHMALDPGRGRSAVPGRSAIAAAALGITGVVAALVVGASLGRLETEPGRWSWGYDTIVQGENGLTHPAGDPACAPVRTTLSSLPQVAAIANLCENTVTVGDRSVNAMGIRRIRGTIRPTILRGHALRARDDVVLGEKTLARLGKSIGDHVMVRSGRLHVDALIVGSTLFPTPNSHDTVTLADGALMRADTLARLGAGTFPQIVIRWRPGTDLHRALAQVRSRSGAPGIGPVRPPEVDRLLQLDNLPAILAGFLALLALTGVAHAVVTNASRRRRDLALLQTLGFRIRQIAGTIAAHALTIGVIGLAIGIPLGIVVGRLAWSAIAHGVGIADDADLPLLLLATTVPLALVAVLVIAYVPSRTASRIRPAVALRSE